LLEAQFQVAGASDDTHSTDETAFHFNYTPDGIVDVPASV
jgi:hypothetical protein